MSDYRKSYCGIRLHWQTRTVCPIHLAHESANAGRRPLSKAVSVPAALLASTAAAITVATDPEHLLRSWLAITCNSEQPALGTPSELQYTQSQKSSYHKHITILACLAIFGGRENGMASKLFTVSGAPCSSKSRVPLVRATPPFRLRSCARSPHFCPIPTDRACT